MIRTIVQVKDAGQIRDLCHQALGYDSTLESGSSDRKIQSARLRALLFCLRRGNKQAIFLVMWKQRSTKVFIVTPGLMF